MVRRCTSLGPSAICSARVIANSRASTVSSLTPAAPKVCTARLTTLWATSIAATLIAATSERAAALPLVSISHAALRVEQPDLVDLDAAAGDPLADDAPVGQRAAERLAVDGALAHQLAARARRSRWRASRSASGPGPSRPWAMREAVALVAEHVGRPGTRTSVNCDLAVAEPVAGSRTSAGRAGPRCPGRRRAPGSCSAGGTSAPSGRTCP